MSWGNDHYPDGAANDPRAPWNQGDPDPVICDTCGHEPEEPEEAEEGGQCDHEFNEAENGDGPARYVRCEGHYVSTRCDTCGHINCNCE